MKLQQFLEHHGMSRNPFAEEDAQTDPVFKDGCIETTYHPTWDKVYGDPGEPSTAIVLGEKGAGKTAMRLQIAKHLADFNKANPDKRAIVVHYDDFNPFLDRFRERLSRSQRRPDKVLNHWKLWDHIDAILCVATTGLIDRLIGAPQSPGIEADVTPSDAQKLDANQKRDLLLLAACYDQSTSNTYAGRWDSLRKTLGFFSWQSWIPLVTGIVGTLLTLGLVYLLFFKLDANKTVWGTICGIVFVGFWWPFLWRLLKFRWLAWKVHHRVRVGNRDTNSLWQTLLHFSTTEVANQPLPRKDSTDDRYEMLMKLQSILTTLGYKGILVLVDRVDEPHLINGSAELMKGLVWPMLDNKFLKHPGLGVKLMLPIELTRFIEREDRDFYQRARLDKQNMIPSFEWTGQALYDVTNARIRACAAPGAQPSLRGMISSNISDPRLIEALRSLRVPRRVLKFLYRTLVVHCNSYSDEKPSWTVSSEVFESTLALALRDADAFDRGTGSG